MLRQHYHLAVLWLLSCVAQGVVETIYRHGHDDGEEALRQFMRRQLLEVQVAASADRARAYQRGFADAMRLSDDDVPAAKPVERVM
jgi:hypothetical protein